MLKLAIPLATLLLAAVSASPSRAATEALACQTVNDETLCVRGSGSLNCQTINGHTICLGSGGLRCKRVNGRLMCSGGHGAKVQRFGPNQRILIPRAFDHQDGSAVAIERDGRKLRVRTATGIEIELD